jgi:hypothetical protein
MGATLNMASATNAYVLSDRATWLSFKNKGDLVIVVEGDKRLFNQYDVMLVNPQKHPNRNSVSNSSIGWFRPRARRRSPITRSTASNCSTQTSITRGVMRTQVSESHWPFLRRANYSA